MKFAGINKRFTDTVYAFLNMGYTINTNTMNCLEADTLGKVDVTDGKKIVRIMLHEFREQAEVQENGWTPRLYGVELVVGVATENLKPNSRNFDGIWNHRLNIISEEKFYRIGDWDSDWYGTAAEAFAREKMHRQRLRDSWEGEYVLFGENAKAIVLPFLRRQKNCKTATVKAITRVSKCVRPDCPGKSVEYAVAYKGREFVMN